MQYSKTQSHLNMSIKGNIAANIATRFMTQQLQLLSGTQIRIMQKNKLIDQFKYKHMKC